MEPRVSAPRLWWAGVAVAGTMLLPVTGLASPKSDVTAAIAAAGPAEVERFFGEARDEDGRVVYRERHEITRVAGKRTKSVTYYYSGDRKLVAKLVNTYDKDPYAPDYQFIDYRTKQNEGASLRGRNVMLFHGAERETLPFVAKGDDRITTGQGLDHMIRNRLDDLARGERITVAYAFPSKLDTYTFRLSAQRAPRPGVVRVRIDLDDWFLRLFAPHLEADYDRETGRLLSYSGISNLKDAEGNNEKVTIRYSYPAGS